MKNLAALSIDLDDTLWPITPVIYEAERQLYSWLEENCPRVTRQHAPDDLASLREAVTRDHPDRAHDFSFLRREVLGRLLEQSGYDAELAEPAYAVFFAARNNVTIFDDVVPALASLRRRFVLVAVTNGNADLRQIGLSDYFHHIIRAADVGAAKPDAKIFEATAAAAGVQPTRILHIGDAPLDDVAGAAAAGMHTVWINRFERVWPANQPPATAEITSLSELAELLAR